MNFVTCRKISLLMILLAFIQFLPFLNSFEIALNENIAGWTNGHINIYLITGSVIFLFLSYVFQEGYKLKSDNDLTI